MEPRDEYERYLRAVVADLQESYHRAVKPYLEKLAELQATRPLGPFVVSYEHMKGIDIRAVEDDEMVVPLVKYDGPQADKP